MVLGPIRVSKTLKNSGRVIKFDGFRFSTRDSISEVVGGPFEAVLGSKMGPKWDILGSNFESFLEWISGVQNGTQMGHFGVHLD